MATKPGAVFYFPRNTLDSWGIPAGARDNAIVDHVNGQRNAMIGLLFTTVSSLAIAGYYKLDAYIASKSQDAGLLGGRQVNGQQPQSKCNDTATVVPFMYENPHTQALLGTCTQALTACQSQNFQLSYTNTNVQQMLDSVRGNLTDCNTEKTQIAGQRQQLEQELAALQSGLVATLQTDLSECNAQKTLFEGQKQQIQQQLDALLATPAGNQIAQIEAQKQQLQQQLDKLSADLLESNSQKSLIEGRLQDLQSTVPSLQVVNEEALANFATCMTALQECTSEQNG